MQQPQKSYEELYDDQVKMEKHSHETAIEDLRKQQETFILNGQEFKTRPAQEVLKAILPIIEDYIRRLYVKAPSQKPFFHDYIKPRWKQSLLDKENKVNKFEAVQDPAIELSHKVGLTLVRNLSTGATLNNIVEGIAREAVPMFRPEKDAYHELRDIAVQFFTPLVDEIKCLSGVFELQSTHNREWRIVVNDEWRERIDEMNKHFGLNVCHHKPMVLPPLPHSNLTSGRGGYLMNHSPLLKSVPNINEDTTKLLRYFNAKTQPEWFEAINKAQATPYCINMRVFEFLQKLHAEGKSFCKFPTKVDEEFIEKAWKKEIEKRNEKRKRKMGDEYKPLLESTEEIVAGAMKRKMDAGVKKTNRLTQMAEDFSKYAEFYFPLFVDYRGRRYPYASTSLSFQGDEMAKALIQFANKKVLTKRGANAMFETLGNLLGHGRKPRHVKGQIAVKWLAKHEEQFRAGDFDFLVEDSYEEHPKYEEHINIIAIVLELLAYSDADDAGKEYMCGYILHQDARCSGASIIATCFNDEDIMRKTSVLPYFDENGNLGDVYLKAADAAYELCEKKAETCDNHVALSVLRDTLFIRERFKNPVMTKTAYGATDYGVRKENSEKVDWEALQLTKEHKQAYDELMLIAVREAIPSCYNYLEAVRKAGKAYIDKHECICFSNPITGFPVVHREYNKESIEINTRFNGRRSRLSLITRLDTVNKFKMVNAIAPNVIHSIDAALLNLVEQQVKFDLSLIHDSFGSHPNDAPLVVKAYSNAMRYLSNNNVIQKIFDEMGVDVKMERTSTFKGEWEFSPHCLV